MRREFTPREDTIILGREGGDGMWFLSFVDDASGEEVRINLPQGQLGEIDDEFTGAPSY
jgi:hypothetical protein